MINYRERRIDLIICSICLLVVFSAQSQEIISLYPDSIPNSKVVDNKNEIFENGMYRHITEPTIEIYLPNKEQSSGTAVIICPGGGYSVLVYEGEGIMAAKQFAKNGIAAFVLKYRLPDNDFQYDKKIAPLQDAQQAIKIIRQNANRWSVNPHSIGIVGFSAGGHLAATLATHFNDVLIDNPDSICLRPDFQILVYPVISMQDGLTHADSKKQLLGRNPSKEDVDFFSNELQVTQNSPKAYITVAGDDLLVDVDNSIFYFEKLRKLHVLVELHIYQKGGHGFIFGHPGWIKPLFDWMKDAGLLDI